MAVSCFEPILADLGDFEQCGVEIAETTVVCNVHEVGKDHVEDFRW